MKSYTDIDQSKKLVEILPIESADMYYKTVLPQSPNLHKIPEIGNPIEDLEWYNNSYTLSGKEPLTLEEYCIPCWSLAALLSVLPNKIVSRETAFEGEDAKGINDIYYKCIESTEDDRYMCRYVGNGYKYECVADNPINACYEMILKLHELKLL